MIDPVSVADALHGRPGLEAEHKPCEACGLLPLYFSNEHGHVFRVDGCFGGALLFVVNGCCGHGGRKPAYLRIARTGSGCVDIRGGQVFTKLEGIA